MKNLLTCLIIMASILSSATFAAIQPTETLYSGKGYPYKPLIDRADSVKIIYSENKDNRIQCSIRMVVAGKELNSSKMLTSKTKFGQEPLASCLSRDTAKKLLAMTFD